MRGGRDGTPAARAHNGCVRRHGLSHAHVGAALRRQIRRGACLPGQPINQDEVASQLGVSCMPVREALRTLAVEGLGPFQPNRGAVVTELDGATEMPRLTRMIAGLRTIVKPYSRIYIHLPERIGQVDRKHHELPEAYRRHAPDAAERGVVEHLSSPSHVLQVHLQDDVSR